MGEKHPQFATSLSNLGLLYYSQERYNEAEPLYLQALEIREENLSADHPDVAQSLNNLASLYTSQGRYQEAELHYVRGLDILFQVFGQNHSNTQILLNGFVIPNPLELAYNRGR